jgi:hypothetical protein
MYKGIAANRIVRLNVDGSLDASLFPGLVLNGAVNVIKVVSTGSIMVGGTLKKYNGTDVNRLVLLDSNGVIVPSFDTGSGPSSAAVNTLENASRWLVVCRWFFSIFESQNQGRLAKLMQMVY